jgi:hypothetical protein
MNLKELKSMIAKEYKSYMMEQAAPTVDVDDMDVDATEGDENPEDTLKDIYDMLKDYFEGDAAGADADMDAGDADMEDDAEDADDADAEEDAEALQERFKKLANIIKG